MNKSPALNQYITRNQCGGGGLIERLSLFLSLEICLLEASYLHAKRPLSGLLDVCPTASGSEQGCSSFNSRSAAFLDSRVLSFSAVFFNGFYRDIAYFIRSNIAFSSHAICSGTSTPKSPLPTFFPDAPPIFQAEIKFNSSRLCLLFLLIECRYSAEGSKFCKRLCANSVFSNAIGLQPASGIKPFHCSRQKVSAILCIANFSQDDVFHSLSRNSKLRGKFRNCSSGPIHGNNETVAICFFCAHDLVEKKAIPQEHTSKAQGGNTLFDLVRALGASVCGWRKHLGRLHRMNASQAIRLRNELSSGQDLDLQLPVRGRVFAPCSH